ncbi:MAG: hypothetical protein OXP70_07875 [Acidobacteriota bacterium]|nr:hypothetical protein [Acidobacteriota bacterium]
MHRSPRRSALTRYCAGIEATATTPPSFAERAAALRAIGWSDRQADWLTLVCLHSGVFIRSQYQARYNVTDGPTARFVRFLIGAGVVREAGSLDQRAYRPTRICHVHSRALYRALGIEDNRHRRNASPELVMRRLLSLDYVLEHPECGWLPTEPEKLAYFQRLGISPSLVPQRVYRGPFADRATPRYLVFKFPIASSGTTTTFVHADPGGEPYLQAGRLRAWMIAHAALWEALRNRRWTVHVVAVTRTAADAAAHAAILESWRGPPAPAAPRSEADQQLLDAVELADSTGDLRPLDVKYGDAIQAARTASRILEQEKAVRGPAKYIDACSTHVAERLTPDMLAA